ncbi:TonB-linked outer membrane protein, SusC/RagA family [Algoriphagus ornithinivorans]|uniref:TonB-linked outer membrane protein, SusC/RagA family n=1 Tax=Algoriphagus ornithinivorans TaxID=226506 RepID=A0A1I5ANY9_9BACT|nr:TonB-dependent receptor [Algoriphagus ornithinivorans]SFN64256.1 TonB-linked outer membrane protein, SusC/RagA family [Algoriphagus ornithinivorans]
MRKVLLLGLMLFLGSAVAFAQNRVITGTVTSTEDNLGVPGATVLVKGTTIGTATDLDGNYSISVPAGSNVLVFSFVGLRQQEVSIGNRTTINVALEPDVQALSEFVITSYGDQSKREITGAIASVKGEVFENLPVQSFDRAMQGRIAGVQVTSTSGAPGGTLNVRIRGVGSINAGNDPLYIVDGVQVASGSLSGQGPQNALASINPNDIESIEVLKDAAAASIYGAQAANGVVLITTKKGKKGTTKTKITAQEGIVQPLNLYEVMNATQLATIKRDAFLNAGLNPANAAATYGNPEDPNLQSYDWVDELYRQGRLSVYDVSVSGGDEKTNFYLSGSYTNQEGQIIESSYERATGRLNVTHRPNKKLTVAANLSLAYQRTLGTIANGNFVNGPFSAGFTMRPNVPIYNEDGSFKADYPSNHNFGYNIVQGVYEELRRGTSVQTVSNLQANYQITPWLSWTSYFGLDFSDNRDENNRPSTIPVFSSFGGQSFYADRRNNNFNTNHNLNFNKKFGDVHTITGLAGYEYKGFQSEETTATGRGFANPTLRYLQNAATPFAVGGFFTEFKRIGVFGNVKYNYDDRYDAEFTIRRDGHSRFGAQNQWGTFGAASVGWRVSSESFMQDLTWLDNLRVRASFGITGNSDIANFASRTLVGNTGQYLGSGSLGLSQLGNDLLTWEESKTINLGVDWTIFNGRLIGTVDFWRKDSESLLFNTPLPIDSGFGGITRNTGSVRNQGIDIDLQTVNVVSGKFQWNTGFNITFLENELTELYDGLDRIGNSLIVGRPISFWYTHRFLGVNPSNGRAMYDDANGGYTYIVGESTLQYIGSGLPTSYGGLSNTFSYGPVSLEVFFQGQFGNLAGNQDMFNLEDWGASTGNLRTNQLSYWKQPGDITTVGRPYEGGQAPGTSNIDTFSTRFLSDGGYVRLKQVTLNYVLPSATAQKIGMQGLSAFVQGLNLATFTKYTGQDPEVVGIAEFVSIGRFPNARQFSAGLTLTF